MLGIFYLVEKVQKLPIYGNKVPSAECSNSCNSAKKEIEVEKMGKISNSKVSRWISLKLRTLLGPSISFFTNL